eukprot:5634996-Prymnesium_polylepis.1
MPPTRTRLHTAHEERCSMAPTSSGWWRLPIRLAGAGQVGPAGTGAGERRGAWQSVAAHPPDPRGKGLHKFSRKGTD